MSVVYQAPLARLLPSSTFTAGAVGADGTKGGHVSIVAGSLLGSRVQLWANGGEHGQVCRDSTRLGVLGNGGNGGAGKDGAAGSNGAGSPSLAAIAPPPANK